MPVEKDLYRCLGVRPDASEIEIHTAYWSLLRVYHPDVYRGDPKFALAETEELNAAYEVLSDPAQRREYDETHRVAAPVADRGPGEGPASSPGSGRPPGATYLGSRNSVAWVNLGNGVRDGERVAVRGNSYTATECYVKALELSPNYSMAWYDLGTRMGAEETVTVAGKPYTQLGCLRRALELNPDSPWAWINLGATLDAGDTTTVSWRAYTNRQCFLKALELDQSMSAAWSDLGATMMPEETVDVNQVPFTREECFRMALALDPGNAAARSGLTGASKGGGVAGWREGSFPMPERPPQRLDDVDGWLHTDRCPSCHVRTIPLFAHCPTCGMRLPVSRTRLLGHWLPVHLSKCQKCGHWVDPRTRMCLSCGDMRRGMHRMYGLW